MSDCKALSSHNETPPVLTKSNLFDLIPDKHDLSPGTQVTLRCAPNLRLEGESSLTCLSTGQWNYTTKPVCKGMDVQGEKAWYDSTRNLVIFCVMWGLAAVLVLALVIKIITLLIRRTQKEHQEMFEKHGGSYIHGGEGNENHRYRKHGEHYSQHAGHHSQHGKHHSQHVGHHSKHGEHHSQHGKHHTQHGGHHSQHGEHHSEHGEHHSQHGERHSQHGGHHSQHADENGHHDQHGHHNKAYGHTEHIEKNNGHGHHKGGHGHRANHENREHTDGHNHTQRNHEHSHQSKGHHQHKASHGHHDHREHHGHHRSIYDQSSEHDEALAAAAYGIELHKF